MKLQQQPNGQYTVTVPKDIVIGFAWQKHDVLEFRIIGEGQLKISRKK